MGRKYSLQVRLYVMEERDKGKTWREVSNGIKARFGIKAPTMRMMQKWLRETEREKLSRMLVEETKKKMPHFISLENIYSVRFLSTNTGARINRM